VSGNTAVVERGVSVIDDLSENKGLVLHARSEGCVTGLVAKLELRRLGHSVLVRAPNEFDGVANRCVESERDITKNTLSRRDPDGVRRTSSVAASASSHLRRRWHVRAGGGAELGHTLLNAAVITAVVPTRGAGAILAGGVGRWRGRIACARVTRRGGGRHVRGRACARIARTATGTVATSTSVLAGRSRVRRGSHGRVRSTTTVFHRNRGSHTSKDGSSANKSSNEGDHCVKKIKDRE